ncbi:MAG TPA: SDR family oxidoreductase [Oceanobacillus sp.]|nr:SDR family oxidoreductase [Oceanobacillus sp.]
MSETHFLVTGALGCVGAWVVRNLVQSGVTVTIYDLGTDLKRLKLLMSDEEIAKIRFAQGGDVTNLDMLKRTFDENNFTHVIHLAALQVPFCRANPSLGAQVNVTGTVNLFEAVRHAGLKRLVYASSVAVYGPRENYPPGLLAHDAPLDPRNLYGVYKQANEGTARIYHADWGISSIGLRPYTIYGPGRDQGMTSAPTNAMLAAVRGESFHIPFGGRCAYQHADDVAKLFIQAAYVPFKGAGVFNLKGEIAHMREVIEMIERAVLESKGKITFDDTPLALPEGADDSELRKVVGSVPSRPLAEGIAQTIEHFRQAKAAGIL